MEPEVVLPTDKEGWIIQLSDMKQIKVLHNMYSY